MTEQPLKLEDLTGEVEYRTASGTVASAHISSRIRYPRPEDCTYPEPYKSAWNGKIFVSPTQAAIDRGDWWPARGEADMHWSEFARLENGREVQAG